jgi:hypothetical protein
MMIADDFKTEAATALASYAATMAPKALDSLWNWYMGPTTEEE